MKVHESDDVERSGRFFEGERALVITGILGFILALMIEIFILLQGPIILPEGNLRDAFSFNAAIGMFVLSIAAILPFAKLPTRKRRMLRWFLISATLYSYGIETIQNFRGYNPRFSQAGTLIDNIGGMLFGVVSLILVIITLLLTVQFFRIKAPSERLWLIMGIRYAFLSIFLANVAGIWMIILQDRFIGSEGNFIILHGMGFHAIQALLLTGWLLDRAILSHRDKRWLMHVGSLCWMLCIILIGIQTALGHTVFERTTLPITAVILFLIWLGTTIAAGVLFMKKGRKSVGHGFDATPKS